MNEKPTPSDGVIETVARILFDDVHQHAATGRRWLSVTDTVRDRYRADARSALTVVMPQLSADVLHHAADELNLVSADEWTRGDCVNWLRRQAEAVLT